MHRCPLGDHPPTLTPPLHHTSRLCAPVLDRMIVFGGEACTILWNDVWVLTLSGQPTWSSLQPLGIAPAARVYASAIYDAPHDRIVIFGGASATSPYYLNDCWALS